MAKLLFRVEDLADSFEERPLAPGPPADEDDYDEHDGGEDDAD